MVASASIRVTGTMPSAAPENVLAVYAATDGGEKKVAEKTGAYPLEVRVGDMTPGTYRIVTVSTANGQSVTSESRVRVAAKAPAQTNQPKDAAPTQQPASEPTQQPAATKAPAADPAANHEPPKKEEPAAKEAVITVETKTSRSFIPFRTEYVDDPEMFADAPETVSREGIGGEVVTTYKVTYTDGVETAREKVSETVAIEPVSKIIRRGTKSHTVSTQDVTEEQAIPMETVYEDDPNTFADAPQSVMQEGAEGRKAITWRVEYTDGKKTGREKVSEAVTKDMVPRKIRRGTKQHEITYREETVTETIPFTETVLYDDEMYNTDDFISLQGVNGEKQVTYRITVTDGKDTGRVPVSETVTREPVNQVHYYGTLDPKEDIEITYEQIGISPSGMGGQSYGALTSHAKSWAMHMAKQQQISHSGDTNYLESVGCFETTDEIMPRLIAHVPAVASDPYFGIGVVKETVTSKKFQTVNVHYYAAINSATQSQIDVLEGSLSD